MTVALNDLPNSFATCALKPWLVARATEPHTERRLRRYIAYVHLIRKPPNIGFHGHEASGKQNRVRRKSFLDREI